MFALGVIAVQQPGLRPTLEYPGEPGVVTAGESLMGSVVVRGTGYAEAQAVSLKVELAGKIVHEAKGKVGGKSGDWTATFPVPVPADAVGKRVLRVGVDPLESEVTTDNNDTATTLQVVAPK